MNKSLYYLNLLQFIMRTHSEPKTSTHESMYTRFERKTSEHFVFRALPRLLGHPFSTRRSINMKASNIDKLCGHKLSTKLPMKFFGKPRRFLATLSIFPAKPIDRTYCKKPHRSLLGNSFVFVGYELARTFMRIVLGQVRIVSIND